MTPPPDDDEHDCGWKAYAKHQEAKLAEVQQKLAALEKRLLGKKSERRKSSKMPPPVSSSKSAQETKRKREQNAALREAKLQTEVTERPVHKCEHCDSTKLENVSNRPSVVYEYVQPHFRKRVYQRQTVRCENGHMTTAPAPERVGEKIRYDASFIAHLVTSKCRDSIPFYRMEKAYNSIGIPISRSTMTTLFYRAAEELRPLHAAAFRMVRLSLDVHADETSFRQQDIDKRAFVWGFVTSEVTAYRYAATRSGGIPVEVLGDSEGRLVVDMYTGYNVVTRTGKRIRAGCLAHARRKLWDNRHYSLTETGLELIGQIYAIEHEAKAADILGTEQHLELRKTRSRPLFARLLWWARAECRNLDPSSALAKSLRYITRNFRELGCFLRYASLPPDNNKAEAALRRVALGRANFLFVANEQRGVDLGVLYTLVATCQQHGIDPIAYLSDVLLRVQTHPASRVDELLPHRWKPPNPD